MPAARSRHPGAGEAQKALQAARVLRHVGYLANSGFRWPLHCTHASQLNGSSDTSLVTQPWVHHICNKSRQRSFWASASAQFLLREDFLSTQKHHLSQNASGLHAQFKCPTVFNNSPTSEVGGYQAAYLYIPWPP